MEELYTVKEVSKVLKTSIPFVYKLIKAKQIKALKLGHIKVRKSEIERFMRDSEGLDITDPHNIKPFALQGEYYE